MFFRRLLQRLICSCIANLATPALAAGVYAQLVVPFPSPRTYTQTYLPLEQALVLEFAKTAPNELQAFERYDERLVKRVIIKDLGPGGTEVKLVLRDSGVRASINQFDEPFRVTIDLFDAGYKEDVDPVSGLPMPAAADSASRTLLAPGDATDAGASGLADAASPQHAGPPHDAHGDDAADHSAAPAQPKSGSRRLLQPMPDLFTRPEELTEAMRAAPESVGKAWRDFPPYIYRIQTAVFEGGARTKGPSPLQAVTAATAMAAYAGNLYDTGNEAKALVAYQQVLHKDPALFNKDALHLWKFAESHFGQGNLTLARGYYDAMTEKFPESPLADFARLRLLDITALKLLAEARTQDLPQLADGLAKLKPRGQGELLAQIAVRKAYWSKAGIPAAGAPAPHIPELTAAGATELHNTYPQVESPVTGFLAATLLLGSMVRADTPWVRTTGPFADTYFKRYTAERHAPYTTQLRDRLYAKINRSLQAKVSAGKLIEAIEDFEALPPSMQSIKKNPATAWALAEAYRKLGQTAKAVDHFAAAAQTAGATPDAFKAQFWLAVTAGERAAAEASTSAARSERFAAQSRAADRQAGAIWAQLKPDEQQTLSIAYKDAFEATVTGAARLRTGPRIVLSSWTKALTTKATTTSGAAGNPGSDWQQSFSPTGSSVILLSDLGRRFGELGMTKEKRAAVTLLKYMKPSQFPDDQAAKALWSKQLADLAEELRQANQYLDAGRLFSLVGGESENWEGRAEALYKGGLLLYRGGRREEAMAAFEQAAADGNNMFYANLAKERLSQLK